MVSIMYTVPQTIRFQNSLFCLLIVYILMCASASIIYIIYQNDPQISLINLITINWHHVTVT